MAGNEPPRPIAFDQTFVAGAQRAWSDSDLNPPNPAPRAGYNPPANPQPGPPPSPEQYMPPVDVIPPIDQFQSGSPIPPPMPLPPRRYVLPRQPPTWNSAGVGVVPILSDAGAVSPVLAIVAGGIGGYLLGGWKGGIGTAMMVVGANNLGLAGEKTAMRFAAAAIGLGVGGYVVHSAASKTSLVPNPPKWLQKIGRD